MTKRWKLVLLYNYHHSYINCRRLEKSVAIGCAITTKNIGDLTRMTAKQALPLLRTFLPSFCSSISSGYTYSFYLSYDLTDKFFGSNHFDLHTNATYTFETLFFEVIKSECLKDVKVWNKEIL